MPGTRPKLLHLAVAMMCDTGLNQHEQHMMGQQLKFQLDNAHKNIRDSKPSRAAHYKRQAKKRANIRARSGKK